MVLRDGIAVSRWGFGSTINLVDTLFSIGVSPVVEFLFWTALYVWQIIDYFIPKKFSLAEVYEP